MIAKGLMQRDMAVAQLNEAVKRKHIVVSADEFYDNTLLTNNYSYLPASSPFANLCAAIRGWLGGPDLLPHVCLGYRHP